MWDLIQEWDWAIFRLINESWVHPWLDRGLSLMADFRLSKWVLIPAGIGLVIWGGFRGRLFMVLLALALIIGDGGINWTIKRTVNRPRPYQTLEDVRRVTRDGFHHQIRWVSKEPYLKGRSMTSGHVCNNVSLAFLATLLFSPWGRWVWVWAVLMAYSRVYTADHFPTDVVVSFFVSGAYTAGICCFVSFLWQHYAPRYFPKIYERHPQLYGRHG
jgi:undecaprenyl-diphosphatase